MNDSELNAITLLYLSKTWDGDASLLDCAHKFQQTKELLVKELTQEQQDKMNQRFADGTFSF